MSHDRQRPVWRVPEKAEQAHGVQLLRTLGATVYVLGTRRGRGDYQGTCQTPGICDVFAFLPARGPLVRRVLLAWECKAVGGRLSPAQLVFQRCCVLSGIAHLTGPFDALIAWLTSYGYVQGESVPHYRQPKE